MNDTNEYNFPNPSDPDLTINWLALKPGNYGKHTNLLEYTKPIEYSDSIKSPIPVGVADFNSVVYIYPQGTIEIIGNVYCWNKKVKPGIYNAFEKLRFLTGEYIYDIPIDDPASMHASYDKYPQDIEGDYPDKFKFSRVRKTENEYIAEYKYVSFNDQIVMLDNNKVYPIPILDGLITIYPDGSFKTKNMVIDNEDKVVNKYGYLNDYYRPTSLKIYYNNIVKDFDENNESFLRLYKIVSNNEDGSITYGAIDENKELSINKLIPFPKGLIPVNDGSVEITKNGIIILSGLVINTDGYRITKSHLRINELYNTKYNDATINDILLDKSTKYYPVIDLLQEEENDGNYLTNKGMIKDISDGYVYHMDNDTYIVTKDSNNEILNVKYFPMKGWDNFRPDTEEHRYKIIDDILYLSDLNIEDSRNTYDSLDRRNYPYILEYGEFEYGNNYIVPKIRFNPDNEIDLYAIIDHSIFYNYKDKHRGILSSKYLLINLHDYPISSNMDGISKFTLKFENNVDDIDKYIEDNNFILTKYDNKIDKFVPYNVISENNEIIKSEYNISKINNNYYFKSKGNIIWKRDNEYFTLDESNDGVLFNTSWPDIETDENGHYKSIYTVDGYFTDEPIFILKGHGQGYPWHDENENNNSNNNLSPLNIDGIKRQEEGLFKLVKRNVTQYLTKLEKELIDNYKLPNILVYMDEDYKLKHIEYIKLDEKINNQYIEQSITLDYYSFRFNEITPDFLDTTDIFIPTGHDKSVEYSRDSEKLLLKNNIFKSFPIMLSLGNSFNGTNILRYIDDPYSPNKSLNNYLTNNHLSLIRLENDKELNYTNIRNSIIDGSGAYTSRPSFTVPNKHCLEDGPLYIHLERGNINLKHLYWRTNESTLTYQGHVNVTGVQSGLFEVNNIKLKQRTGFVDIWYDDPFNERSGYTIQRVKLLKERKLNDIIITDPEKFIRTTSKVKGESEPNSRILLSRKDNPSEILKETTSDSNGLWKIDLNGIDLIDNDEYIIKQIDEWNNENQLTFTIEPIEYKEGDLLSVKELMGVQNYVYPINLRNKYNLSNVPHLVESKISYNTDEQTYTIHGIVANILGQVYPEGTYKIGTSPIPYYSQVLSIKGKRFHPQIKEKGKEFYKLSNTESYLAKNILYEEKTHYNGEEIRNDLWIIPKAWIDDMEWLYNDYKRKNEDPNTSNKSDVEYHFNILSYLYPRFKDRKIYGSNLNIGRYQDKLIFDGWVELFIPITNSISPDNEDELTIFNSSYIALTVNHHISSVKAKGLPVRQHGINPCEDSFIREGLSFREYYTHYFGVWNISNYLLFDPREINKHIKHKTDSNALFVTKVKDIRQHISPVNPINRFIDVINYGDNGWEYIEGDIHRDIVLPNWLENNHQQYSLIFSNYNLFEIWEHDRNPNITNVIRFDI